MTQIVRGEDKEGTLGAVSRCVVLQMMSPKLYSPDTRNHCIVTVSPHAGTQTLYQTNLVPAH